MREVAKRLMAGSVALSVALSVGLGVVTGGLAPTAASAKAPLSSVKVIDDNMLYVALALEISKKCGTIDARKFKGLNFLFGLRSKANKLGYSDDEINAYRKSDKQKARIRARGVAYVKARGLNPRKAADLCKLGQDEIARKSVIGSLLKAR